jgi:hypothetical protein
MIHLKTIGSEHTLLIALSMVSPFNSASWSAVELITFTCLFLQLKHPARDFLCGRRGIVAYNLTHSLHAGSVLMPAHPSDRISELKVYDSWIVKVMWVGGLTANLIEPETSATSLASEGFNIPSATVSSTPRQIVHNIEGTEMQACFRPV